MYGKQNIVLKSTTDTKLLKKKLYKVFQKNYLNKKNIIY